MLAIVQRGRTTVSDLQGNHRSWTGRPEERFVDWSADGRSLLFWNARTGHVVVRSPGGAIEAVRRQRFPSLPILAPDHHHIAFLSGGHLWLGTWLSVRPRARVSPSCDIASWSDDGSLLLLSCGETVESRSLDGKLQDRIYRTDGALWAPGSHDILFFRNGALWRWDSHQAHKLVSDAAPALAR
jgi:hypothetical protein